MLKTARKMMIAGLLCSWLAPAPVFATSPSEQIERTVRQVMDVVGDAANSQEQRRELLRETLMPRFDWLEMSKQALGKHWSRASGREQEFVSVFADFLGNAYIGQIVSYRNEKVRFVHESVDNEEAQVKTRIVSEKGEPTTVNYRLRRVDGEWKIYDVIVEDISIVVNYRSQFSRILAKGSFDDLVRQLKQKELRARN
ncbi:MAG TPA: ABC transporter substrate-binding protein [Candidatus Binatia bacterium]|nr:ABC transporter substrate-binding protein [Candidatus Binatia bacterium]